MRLVRAFLVVALTGSWALADEAKPADPKPEVTKRKVPYRVVKMLPETGQVLLFDRIHGTHVVAEVGQSLDGYLVDDIDDEEVTLVAENGAQVILTAPPPPRTTRPARKTPAPADPYAEPGDAATAATSDPAATSGPAPVDPYAEPEPPKIAGEGGVRVASAAGSTARAADASAVGSTANPAGSSATTAPVAPTAAPIIDSGEPVLADPYGDPGIAAFAEAVGAAPESAAAAPAEKTAKPPAKPGKPASKAPASSDAASTLAAAATGAPAAAATGASGAVAASPSATASATGTASSPASGSATGTASATIARGELDAALADFGKLAGSFRATFTPDGLRFDAIDEGTLLTKIGLRKGDVVTYVDGQPLRSLDDAANLYARAGAVRNTTLQVVRDGKLVTLRVAIQ